MPLKSILANTITFYADLHRINKIQQANVAKLHAQAIVRLMLQLLKQLNKTFA